MHAVPRVAEHLRVGIVDRTDSRGHLRLVTDQSVVVLPDAATVAADQREPWCPLGCRWPLICSSCAERVRSEAFRWLRELADDHYGFSLEHFLAASGPVPDIRILWRDPLGVVRLFDDGEGS